MLATVLTVVLTAPAAASAAGQRLPDTYVLGGPPGAVPEGVTVHVDGTVWVGSSATGRLYRGDVRHRTLAPVTAEGALERGTTLGLKTDLAMSLRGHTRSRSSTTPHPTGSTWYTWIPVFAPVP